MCQATPLCPPGGHPHPRGLQGTAHSCALALTPSSSKDSAGHQSMSAPPSMVPPNKHPQTPAAVRHQVRAGDTQGSGASETRGVCVHSSLQPAPQSHQLPGVPLLRGAGSGGPGWPRRPSQAAWLVARLPGFQANTTSPHEAPAFPGEETGCIDPSTY